MFLQFNQNVEDSHKVAILDEDGDFADMKFSVIKFNTEPIYDFDVIPGGDKRAKKLIGYKLAEEVDPAKINQAK